MRRLLPVEGGEVDLVALAALYAPAPGRHVRANFVVSTDGATTVDGASAGLSNQADRDLFHLLRSLCDVVLVGATTARRENYGGARSYDGGVPPPIAVVSRSLDLDPAARLFTDTTVRPWVLTVASAPASRRSALASVAHVVDAGEHSVDIPTALSLLAEAGLSRVLCEGGPHLLSDVVAAGALDDLCLSVAPLLAGGAGDRLIAGLPLVPPVPLRLDHVLEDSGTLFLRMSTVRG
ncbi:MAG: dihydrofolate reductase family protein [Frankiaceae bacterium]|nr:dihydrofolate reductase family protein [Frankiaceae bacterium]